MSETRDALGTRATLTIIAPDRQEGHQAIDAAFDEIGRLTSILSTYDPASPISRLNRDGAIDEAPDELLFVLERAAEVARLSGGAFDITVQPVLDLYDRTFLDEGRAPTPEELRAAQALIGQEKIAVEGRRIAFESPGMRISVDGIAKGFIIDRATEVLMEHGSEGSLVEIGGDLRAVGHPVDRDGWTVGLQHPRARDEFLTRVTVSGRAVATSGDYEHYFVEDMSAHHLIDPRTGRSATGVISVTVVAPTALDADALATAVFVLGPDDGLALVERLGDTEALLVTAAGTALRSPGFAALE